jgi:23S rRNA (cytosine1962-C5)-methyltransferase
MNLLQSRQGPRLKLQLARDLTRTLKRGHPWVYQDALRELPPAEAGSQARLFDRRGRYEIARGFYDPNSPIAFRVCTLSPNQSPSDGWVRRQLEQALRLRRSLFDRQTTGFRLCHGEGDGLPGLVCDLYGQFAVIQLDGDGPAGFYDTAGVAAWLVEMLSVQGVYLQQRGTIGQWLIGTAPGQPVPFLENGVRFTANPVDGQKTGFFLDQRENRAQIRTVAADKRVLNLFGYTGGFSVYAGLGGAADVTTIDLAAPALAMAEDHWQLNKLDPVHHRTVTADAFQFLEEAAQQEKQWDLVILDPPSFAPSEKAVAGARAAYQKLIAAGAAVTAPQGLLAAASCSSHIDLSTFLNLCEEGVSQARRRATVLAIHGQPPDHPAPLALPEFRYLKFVLIRLES